MLQSKQNMLGQARYLGSHQTCGRVCVIAMLLNGKLLSQTILKSGLCTKGYVIRSMKKLNLHVPRHPIMVMRLFSLIGTHVKPAKWLTVCERIKTNENSATNSHELSNVFNDHFSTIGTKLANEVPLVIDGSSYAVRIVSSNNKFIFSPISSSNLFSLLNKLSKSKATRLNNISGKLIRESADLISIPLCNIFNKSLSSGLFPDEWKCARMMMFF